MNKLEETKFKLEIMGFQVNLTRHIRKNGTLSNVSLWAKREFNTTDPSVLRVEVETLKKLIPDYHTIELNISNFYESTTLGVFWYPEDSTLNPKSTKDVKLVGEYCQCSQLPDDLNE